MFHPNGKYLLSAADDHTIRIWELKTGRCIRKIEAHERFVSSLAWGRQTISSDTNGKASGSSGPLLMNVIASASSDQVTWKSPCTLYVDWSSHADVEDMDAMMARAGVSPESTHPPLISPAGCNTCFQLTITEYAIPPPDNTASSFFHTRYHPVCQHWMNAAVRQMLAIFAGLSPLVNMGSCK